MSDLAILAVVLVFALLLLWAWRERGRAIAKARAARLIDSAASDAADLLAASIISLRLARETLPAGADEPRKWVAEADMATRAIAGLFESARVYVREAGVARDRDADGFVRLAVAMARAEGRGVALKGDATEIRCAGAPTDALVLVFDLIDALWQRASNRSVTVTLEPTVVRFHAPARDGLDLSAMSARARQLGWDLEAAASDGGVAVTLRSPSVSPPPEALDEMDAEAVGTVH